MENQLIKDAKKSDIISKAQSNAEKTLRTLFGDTAKGYKLEFIFN